MKSLSKQRTVLALFFTAFFCASVGASNLDTIGVTLLRTVTTNLNGQGIRVGQAEAGDPLPYWEVDPTNISVEQPINLFTYIEGTSPYFSVSVANTYTNSLGEDSTHSDNVAGNFYGTPGGVATNVAHVDNYEADTFINYYINQQHSISDRVVNQSFTYGSYDTNVDQIYDNYAANNGVLFVTGAGFNGQPVYSPATCYNGIGVGVAGINNSPYGPTPDGRSKPDIIAPGTPDVVTSYTTPQVAGGAVLLMQAGTRGDGGGDTNSVTDIRTVKALLLNGAIKPIGWTNSPSAPLDTQFGAGMLNIFNSYEQLAGGKRSYVVSTSVLTNSAHPPTGDTGTVGVLSGWDFNTNSSGTNFDGVKHYYFNVTNNLNNAPFTATATLVWNRHKNKTGINNLDLFLYGTLSSNLVACSTSLVDNVEHIFMPQLPHGRYDLQVWKAGGNFVTSNETYALAFEFSSQSLNVTGSGTNIALSWPAYPAGFVVESTTNLAPASWSTNGIPASIVTNNQNYIFLNTTNADQFFRLREPNF